MIFYFSGTGNSLYAAKYLLDTEEELIDMTECVQQKKFKFTCDPGQRIGFVCPVYYGGLPSIVQQFLNHFELNGDEPSYTFSVITCGAEIYGAGNMLAERLAECGIVLDSVFKIVMPDNYIVMYDIQSEEEEAKILEEAEGKLQEIKENLDNHLVNDVRGSVKDRAMTAVMYPLYAKGRSTKKFWTDDRCVSCGVCEKRCPSKAIKLIDGQVTWVKDQCAHCMACARCNAIQYGKKTVNRRRYAHPDLKAKKGCH